MGKVTLEAARKAKRLTQEEMAEILGISRAMLQQMETGKKPMRPAYLFAYCYITGFNVDDFLLPSEYAKRE